MNETAIENAFKDRGRARKGTRARARDSGQERDRESGRARVGGEGRRYVCTSCVHTKDGSASIQQL